MSLWLIILIDIVVLYLLFGHSLYVRLLPKNWRRRHDLSEAESHLRHLLHRDRDLLDATKIERLEKVIADIHAARQGGGDIAAVLKKYGKYSPDTPSAYENHWRSAADLACFILFLAFGARAMIIQPFQIPTSSMEPTLYGVHFTPQAEPVQISPVQRFFDMIHYSKRYVDLTVEKTGTLSCEPRNLNPKLPLQRFLLPSSEVVIDYKAYILPGAVEDLKRIKTAKGGPESKLSLAMQRGISPEFTKGEILARGAMESGDHLFVDRTYLAFHEPKRGDITVFMTDGIVGPRGPLMGKYYIKRLVCLPGDTLRITGHKLYIKAKDETEFRLMDKSVHPAFERIYSFKGGYRGYCHLDGASYLRTDEETYTVPEDCYFMMGDNSENSSDSRVWGTVPRRNLVGRALCVWWPFGRHWGGVDKTEPEDWDSPASPFYRDNFR